jgi:UDP-N-acetylmuramate: L-alanyl-gamma-D-glutamyl-meso-diaminopimelate ligase
MHLHVLGICGTFMGGLAALAREAGHRVTGCDQNVYPPMSDQLAALGIELISGYGADQLALAPDLFVVGNAITRGNPLLEAILDANAAYTSGPQWLAAEVLAGRHVLAVAGTHGKTGTTSMLAWILEQAGRPVSRGRRAYSTSRRAWQRQGAVRHRGRRIRHRVLRQAQQAVHYRPRTAILNNLEFDHADIFDDPGDRGQFHHLFAPCRAVAGWSSMCATMLQRVLAMGSDEVQRLAAERKRPGCYAASRMPDVLRGGLKIARVDWTLLGEHNQLNALAAIGAAEHVGIAPEVSARALASFRNVRRRLELVGVADGVAVYDDFAHHPTAMRTTIEGLRRKVGPARILAVFEPRSNTMKLGAMKAQLPWALEEADLAFCHSGALDWDATQALAPLGARAVVAATIDDLVGRVVAAARSGDHVLCMSNGGFGGVHRKLLDALARNGRAAA